MPHSYPDSSVKLPDVHAIGFAGASHSADQALCRAAIDRFLADRLGVAGRILCAVSSAAAGLPLIFAESCLAAGIPLRLLLPSPRDAFLEGCGAMDGSRFERVIDSSISVEVAGSEGPLEERYYECGLQVVQQCHELLAVWNGQPSTGLGSVGETVAFAGQMRRPVVWIHSETGVVQTTPPRGDRDDGAVRELTFLNELPSAEPAADSDDPIALVQAWLAKLDANAARLAPQVRRLAALPIVCTALAAFVSAAAQSRRAPGVWIAAGGVLGLIAAVLPAALRLGKRQALWVRIRTAAEVTRSVLALWDTPVRYQIVGPEILPELDSMVRSLDLLKARADRAQNIGLAQFQQQYIELRLLDQVRYFSRQSSHSAAMGQRYRLVSKICAAGAIVLSAWMFVSRSVMKMGDSVSGGSWLSLVASALFQLATIAGALLVVHECERRERRYQEIHRSLADWEIELRAFHTWPPVIEVVSKIERALLVELLEWRSLLRNMKMPRN
jgi:hypothetical protein